MTLKGHYAFGSKTHVQWCCYVFIQFHIQSAFTQRMISADVQPHVS